MPAGQVDLKELLENGVHFGHQTRRWNPKMRRFIHGERAGIYIIDLLKTQELLTEAQEFASGVAHRGGTVLFVGTKKQARDGIKEVAEAAGMPYVNHRWLGGLLTNFGTITNRIKRLHDLERYERGVSSTSSRRASASPPERTSRDCAPTSAASRTCRARPTRCSSSTSRSRRSPSRRRDASASRSSAWSTRTATRTRSTTSSRATTTRSSRA